jgi:hypothetical protein
VFLHGYGLSRRRGQDQVKSARPWAGVNWLPDGSVDQVKTSERWEAAGLHIMKMYSRRHQIWRW